MYVAAQEAGAQGPLAEFTNRAVDYLPTLAAGLLVLALGLAAGWVVKRAVVRILIWLRLDRLGGRFAWRAAFGKGDVRAALYNVLGTVAMIVIVLLVLGNVLEIWGLTVLARDLEALARYFPNLLLVALIVGLGVLLANTLAERVEDALEDEGFEHPRLLARSFKAALLAVVGALGLWQLDFAREVVLAAFLIGFGAIGVAFAIGVGLGSAKAMQRVWENIFNKSSDS